MADYVLITDTASDLDAKYCHDNKVEMVNLTFSVDETEYKSLEELPIKDFYDFMRKGHMTRTSQVAMDVFIIEFTRYLMKGQDILYIAFSSNLSGTYSAAKYVADQLSEKFPERKIHIVDSLCASLGQGLLVMHAIEKKKEGYNIDELTDWLNNNKLNVVHMFTVEDLIYLHRGGRVSKTAAVAGSLLGIKPILHVSDDGKLIPLEKIRGRKQSLDRIVSSMIEHVGDYKNTFFTLSHGDCIEDAKYVESEIKKKLGIKSCYINYVGPVIGAHSGPGTIALFLMGEKR